MNKTFNQKYTKQFESYQVVYLLKSFENTIEERHHSIFDTIFNFFVSIERKDNRLMASKNDAKNADDC